MIDIFLKGIKCAVSNKLRIILTITGITVGVSSVMLVSFIGNTGVSAINTELSGMGMDSLIISASDLNEDSLSAVKKISNVSDAMPLMNKVTTVSAYNENYSSMVWGVNENADKVIDLKVEHGRLINRGDLANKQQVCVVDEAMAVNCFNRTNVIGKHISVVLNGKEKSFEVIGVVKNGVNTLQNMLGGFIPDFIYIPYTVMQEDTSSYKFDNITVRLNESDKSDETADLIKRSLLHNNDTVNVENLLKQKENMTEIMNIASVALSVVAGISIIVSGISIMTVMLVSVNERTREIGIKKSIGAKTRDIMAEFLFETVIITLIGGISGIFIGSLLSFFISIISGTTFHFDLKTSVVMLLVSIVSGIVFGVYPARKASLLKPAEALRQE